MKNKQLVAFLCALGVVVYTTIIAFIMQHGEQIFGKMNNLLGPVVFLMLFVLSAAIVGALVLGKPVMMYLDGEKKDAVKMFAETMLWLFVATLIALLTQIIA
jgi:hypothetical protein